LAREPVAMTTLRAVTSTEAEATLRGPVKRAASRTTVTPRPSKRAWLSWGSMAAMAERTWAMTAAKSTLGSAVIPRREALRASWAAWAAAISALEGTQPVLRQSPPISPFSKSTTRRPSWAAPEATDRPPEPAPMTTMSAFMRFIGRPPFSCRARLSRPPARS
jgi:hypothetical protein